MEPSPSQFPGLPRSYSGGCMAHLDHRLVCITVRSRFRNTNLLGLTSLPLVHRSNGPFLSLPPYYDHLASFTLLTSFLTAFQLMCIKLTKHVSCGAHKTFWIRFSHDFKDLRESSSLPAPTTTSSPATGTCGRTGNQAAIHLIVLCNPVLNPRPTSLPVPPHKALVRCFILALLGPQPVCWETP